MVDTFEGQNVSIRNNESNPMDAEAETKSLMYETK